MRFPITHKFGSDNCAELDIGKTGQTSPHDDVARWLELDPLYCDVICRRFLDFTGIQPVHAASGRAFAELERARQIPTNM